jgi:DNA invertase Pin-like site-specific DNA recombinase
MGTYAGLLRISQLGERRGGDVMNHADREQTEAVRGAVPAGHELDLLPPEYDVSGGLGIADRPSLRAAVEGVERGKYVGLILAYQSRLMRDVEHEEEVWRRVKKAGGTIILAMDGIDTSTVSGEMVRRIRGAINHAERAEHCVRFDRLRKWSTDQGIWQTSVMPRGYLKDPSTRTLVPDPATAPAVREAFEMKARNASVRTIALHLGMSPSATADLLKSRLYLGELKVGPYVNEAAHEPLVDEDLWLRAQHAKCPVYAQPDGPLLLTGHLVCAGCGYRMSRQSNRAGAAYSCSRIHATGRCPAPAAITARLLDAHVDEIIRGELAKIDGKAGRADTALRAARAARAAAVAERDAFVEGVRASEVGADVFGAGLRARQEDVSTCEAELAQQLAGREAIGASGDPSALWERMTVAQRNHALGGLVERVTVARSGGRGGGKGPRLSLANRVTVVGVGGAILAGPEVQDVVGVDLASCAL